MILNLATGPLAQAVGWALLNLVWQGAAIAAVLGLLLGMLPSRSANLRYALSCAALALVVAMGVATGLRSYPRAGLPSTAGALAKSLAPLQTTLSRPIAPVVSVPSAAPVATPSVSTIVVATFAPARVGRMPDPVRAATEALPVIVTLWLVGVALLSLRLLCQWLQARRLVTQDAQPACEPWLSMARRLARALRVRHAVRLLESTAVQVPAVIGLVRPVILLPVNTLGGLLPGQLEMILAHELAHIRRHDFLVNLLQAVVETLLFYHPAVWWISRQVRIERENCCDDLAVSVCGSPLQYARALTRLEELRAAVLPLALSARGGSLVDRIRRVVSGPERSIAPVRGVVALAALACVLLAVATPSLTAIAKPQPASLEKTHLLVKKSARTELKTKTMTETTVQTVPLGEPARPDDASVDAAADAAAEATVDAVTADLSDHVDHAGFGPSANRDDDDLEPNSNAAIARGHLRLTVDELIQLRSQGVTTSGILEMRFLFPKIDIRDIAGMYAVGATPEYVRRMRATGLDVDSPGEAQSMAAVGVTPEFIAELRRAGLEVESANAASSLAAVGVTADFVRGMSAAGLKVTSANEAQSLAAVGVTADYIREMREAGLKVATAEDAQSLAALGVRPEFIREMRESGFPVMSANEAQGLAAVGVTADYVREMRETGFRIESAKDAQGLAALGVTPDYVREMGETGLRVETAADLQGLAALGVSPDWVREMRAAGVPLREAKDAQSLRALGVTPKFVRKLAKAGFTNLSVKELSKLAAGGMTDSFIEEMSQYRKK